MSGDFEQAESRVCQSEGTYVTMRPLASSWEQRKLGDCASFGGGHTPSMADSENYDGGNIPWVTSQDVKTHYLAETSTLITAKGARELTFYPVGSIAMVTRSGILRHTLPVAELHKPMVVNQDIRVIIPHKELSGQWLLQYLIGHERPLLLEYGKVGTTVESVDFSKMQGMTFPLPKMDEQCVIGAFFASIDNLITLHQREPPHTMKEGKNANRYQWRIAFLRLLLAMD